MRNIDAVQEDRPKLQNFLLNCIQKLEKPI